MGTGTLAPCKPVLSTTLLQTPPAPVATSGTFTTYSIIYTATSALDTSPSRSLNEAVTTGFRLTGHPNLTIEEHLRL